jgi:DNA-binding response OmpR family regulator
MSFALQPEKESGCHQAAVIRMLNVTTKKASVLLVVEDDREMRSLLCDEFWSAGYQLREAKDGHEAFTAVLESVPDLILTDLRMPAGGADYIGRLRTVAPHCPIIVITAFGDGRLRAEVLQAGASAYFDKPVRISELKLKVEELLRNSSHTIA